MKNHILNISLTLIAATLVACGGGSNSTDADKDASNALNSGEPTYTNVFNVSTGTSSEPVFAYYDLDADEELLLTESEAAENAEWDIAFKRTKVYLNQNSSPAVSLFFTNNTGEFYDTEGNADVTRFINATAETEENAFVNADITIPADEEFHADESAAAIDGWYSYNPTTHQVSADDQTFFIVESGSDFAKFNITDLVQDGFGMTSITINRSTQLSGETAFSPTASETFVSTDCTDDIYIDLINLLEVTAADNWDLSLPCTEGAMSFAINIGDDNRAISDINTTAENAIDIDALRYYPWVDNVEVTHAFTTYGDSNSGYGWGDYGVNGGHGLWPNYAIYVIKTPSAYYKFQITNYYDSETEASGTYSFRYEILEVID